MHFVSMDELLSQSDVIVLCAPSGDQPLVDADSIAKMKDGVVIVNVSRGANVDEAALLDALNTGKVRAAGLDVWMSEKDPNWALAQHPAVSCTPHIGCRHQGGPRSASAPSWWISSRVLESRSLRNQDRWTQSPPRFGEGTAAVRPDRGSTSAV